MRPRHTVTACKLMMAGLMLTRILLCCIIVLVRTMVHGHIAVEELIDFVVLPVIVCIPVQELNGFVFLLVFVLVIAVPVEVGLVRVQMLLVLLLVSDFVVPAITVHIAVPQLISIRSVLVAFVAILSPLFSLVPLPLAVS